VNHHKITVIALAEPDLLGRFGLVVLQYPRALDLEAGGKPRREGIKQHHHHEPGDEGEDGGGRDEAPGRNARRPHGREFARTVQADIGGNAAEEKDKGREKQDEAWGPEQGEPEDVRDLGIRPHAYRSR
jgi:hypothetical protein